MKKLFQIVSERHNKQLELNAKLQSYKKEEDRLSKEIQELKSLENVAQDGLDIGKIQLAETCISIQGNPYGETDHLKYGKMIAEEAIIDIANGCEHLKLQYFGNKTYSGFYQRTDCKYGYGPSHGSIVDRIELKDDAQKRELTDDEKDACIYYIKNYIDIRAAKNKLQTT